jgi:hypothetical protein
VSVPSVFLPPFDPYFLAILITASRDTYGQRR